MPQHNVEYGISSTETSDLLNLTLALLCGGERSSLANCTNVTIFGEMGPNQQQNASPSENLLHHGKNLTDFYIGLFLAVISSVFIGSSFILKKKALLKLAGKDATHRAGQGGHGYLKDWMWWSGVITMGVGEACNFAAYAFAPASLVTPLGALSVLVTTVLSSKLLNEKLNLLGKIGCAVCLLGSTVIVLHSPKEENVATMEELGDKMHDAVFIIYVVCVVVGSAFLIIYVAPRYGQSNILIYIIICSVIGSLSVLGCKGLGLAIKETASGTNQFTNWLTWVWLLSVIYLNKSLDIYNTSMVTPIYYIFFTSFVILASGILYKEWTNLESDDILGSVCGFLITVVGIFQMQLFKDVNITLTQLRYLLRRKGTNDSGDGGGGYRFELLPADIKNPEQFLKHYLLPGLRKSYTEPVVHSEDEISPYNSEVDVHQASRRVEA